MDEKTGLRAATQNFENVVPAKAGTLFLLFRGVPNPSKFGEKSMQKVGSFPDRSWDGFFIDFGAILAPSWESKWSQNQYKMVLKK